MATLRMRIIVPTVRTVALIAVCALPMFGQVAGGTLSGMVTDSSGAGLPHAFVKVTNLSTGITRNDSANEAGLYRVPNLVPGVYQVSASAQGFKTGIRSSVMIDVGAEVTANLLLQVGTISETMEVQAGAETLETTSATLSGVINETTVRELPLNARDWTALATLEPGVATIRTQPVLTISNNRPIRGMGTQLTIGGNRPQSNNYRVDGISINDYSNSAPGSALGVDLGVDAIQEFSVVTSNAGANYGKTSGGIVNAVTRSGSNDLHGSAYEFLRNSALDARNFFDGPNIPPFKRNQFGGSLGGPLRKDRTFIFGDYEGLRQTLNTTVVDTVLSPNARAGTLAAGTVKVDPKVLPFLTFLPLPNAGFSGDTGTYTFTAAQISREDFFTVRADHKLSEKNSLYGTYFFDDGSASAPDTFNAVLLGAITRRQMVMAEATHIFNHDFVNSVRAGYSRVVVQAPRALAAINAQAADPAFGFVPGKAVGAFNVAGITGFPGGYGSVGEYDFHYNSYQVYDDSFITKGRHALKFGGAVEYIQINQQGLANPGGVFAFGSLANFLTNKPTSFNAAIPGTITPRRLRQTIVGGYLEDDFIFRPTLTLNLGLRYEMATVPSEVNGKISNLRNLTDPAPTLGSPFFSNPTLKNFEPRLGFAWSPFGNTVIRGGAGMYDVLPLTYNFELLTILAAPFYKQANLGAAPAGSFPTGAFNLLSSSGLRYTSVQPDPPRSYVFQWNLAVERQVAKDLTFSVRYVGTRGVHLPFRADDVNVVQPIAKTSAGYIWPTPRGSGANLNPNVGPISVLYWVVPSTYHGLQTKVSKRMAHGFQLEGSYTWSKSIDEGSSILAGNGFANSIASLPFFDSSLRRGPSDFDVRHVASINYIWRIPNPHRSGVTGWASSGWQLGSILQASSGFPFTPTVAGDPVGLKGFQATFAFPDRLTGPGCGTAMQLTETPGTTQTFVTDIKTQCFAFPVPATRLGNSGRNSLIGPGLLDLDFSVFKNNRIPRISEQFNLQFRAEFFNIVNHTNFAVPSNTQIFAQGGGAPLSNAGQITTTVTPSRQIQFGLKITF